MRKIMGRLLFKIGLYILPKNIGDDVVISWQVRHKNKTYAVFVRYKKHNIAEIKNALSMMGAQTEVTLKELNILPRPEGWITNEMWEEMEKEDKEVVKQL